MASYNELIALIDAYINRNGVQAITGQVLNGVLKAMVDQLGRGYTIMGAAQPTDNPGTPDGPESWFASTPGTYTNFGGLTVATAELALLSYTPSDGWEKNTLTLGITEVDATIDANVGTPQVTANYVNGVLYFDFKNIKGNTGDAAGFGTVNATVDSNIGTPAVQVSTSGPDTAKNMTFAFRNLKGETGVTSVVCTVDNTVGTPSCAVSLVGQELHLDFHGLKGAQGDTGVSADYPITIANNLTTNDPTSALSAAMGVQLESEVSQLELKVSNLDGSYYGVFTSSSNLPDNITQPGYAFVGSTNPFAIWQFDGEEWSDSGATVDGIAGEPGVGFESVASPTPADGTVTITLSNGDTMTLDLNHNHDAYYSKVVGATQPSGGFLPDVVYSLGTLTGTVTFTLAAAVVGNVNHYFWMFDTGSTAPTITWPSTGVTWADGSAPTVAANKHYEVSILGGVAYYSEV